MGLFSGLFGSSSGKEGNRILKELQSLSEEDAEGRKAKREELQGLEDLAIDPIDSWLRRATKVDLPSWMMLDVCEILARAGDDGLLTLAQYARTDPPDRRSSALLGLGMSGSAAAVPVCVEALQGGDEQVVAAACTALKRIGSHEAVEPLAEILRDASRPVKVRAAVASTIAALKGPASVKAIIEAAKDPKLGAVIPGCFAVMGPLVVPAIVDALGDASPSVRLVMVQALAAIGPIGGEKAVEGLQKALRDQEADVRSGAAQALQKLGAFQPLVSALKDDQFDNRFVMQALTQMGTKNPDLVQAYVNLLEAMGKKVSNGSMFVVEKLKEAEHLSAALRYLEQVTQSLPQDSDFMEPALRLKSEVRAALASRRRA